MTGLESERTLEAHLFFDRLIASGVRWRCYVCQFCTNPLQYLCRDELTLSKPLDVRSGGFGESSATGAGVGGRGNIFAVMAKMNFHDVFFARIGARYRWLLALLAIAALAGAAMLPSAAQAQNVWGGTGSTTTTQDYNLGTNWSNPPAGAPPVNAGQAATFEIGRAHV